MSDRSLKLERLTNVGYLNIRGDANDSAFVELVGESCGVQLPTAANAVNGDDSRIYWLGPDEWLLMGGVDSIDAIAETLSQKTADLHVAVNKLHGGQIAYRLAGESARQLLAKGCTLDLHPSVFGVGSCAQTALAKAAVLISPLATGQGYEIIVRRSFADYLWQWLMRAGDEYGIEVT